MDNQLRSCYTLYVYARSRSHILSYNCGYILNSETTVYITSILNRLVAVPVQAYVHRHTIKLYHIYIYVCMYVCDQSVLYSVQLYLFSTRKCVSLVRQILRKLFWFDVCLCLSVFTVCLQFIP